MTRQAPLIQRRRSTARNATVRRTAEFGEVVGKGDRRVGRRLVLYVLSGEGPARAGFVSGRGVGRAVARNRARRILKEAWRSMSPSVVAGTRAVFVARPEIVGAKMPDVVAEMTTLLGHQRLSEGAEG
jgi:ribonuclease P protein component